jgi:hypothetical protein
VATPWGNKEKIESQKKIVAFLTATYSQGRSLASRDSLETKEVTVADGFDQL